MHQVESPYTGQSNAYQVLQTYFFEQSIQDYRRARGGSSGNRKIWKIEKEKARKRPRKRNTRGNLMVVFQVQLLEEAIQKD